MSGKDTVKGTAECARARWKIENGHDNVLKHRGYNLEHNFGHGESHACDIFCLLNLLSFLFHGIQDDDWTSLFLTLAGDVPDG